MHALTFRRLGAALLLALFVPSCTDAPTLPEVPGVAPPAADRASAPDFPSERGVPGLVEHRKSHGDLDLRLYSGRDGKLRHLAARRAGEPKVHLRWHYRGNG